MSATQLYEKKSRRRRYRYLYYVFFEATDFGPVAAYGNFAISSTEKTNSNEVFLDGFLAAIKWIFLYIPGAAAVHMLMVSFPLFFHHQDWSNELQMIRGFSLIYITCMFMIMLGIGKLKDLRYLRVVASIFAVSAIMAVFYGILTVFVPGDFFGFYEKLTLPVTLSVGYFVKMNTDRRSNRFDDQSSTNR